MATYEQTVSSEGEFDFTCTPCTKEDRFSEAKKFCVECGEYFCSICLSCHERFGATKGHTLINCADVSTCHKASQLTKCEIHKDKEEDMVCGGHDVVCCRVCIATDHKSCQDILYLPQAAQNFEDSKKRSELAQDIRRKIEELQLSYRQQKARVVQTKLRKVTFLKRLELFKISMTSLIENLVHDSETEVEETYVPAIRGMQQHMQNTDEQLSRLNVALEHLVNEKDQILVYVKAIECKRVLGEKHEEQCKMDFELPECNTKLNVIAKTVIKSVQDDVHQGVVKIPELDVESDVPSILKLQDGSFYLALYQAKKLIHIDTHLKCADTFKTENGVWGLCTTELNEIAFTMPLIMKVGFLRIDERPTVMKTSLSIAIQCRGIAYRDEKLYIAGGGFEGEECGQILVLDLKGRILQTFKNDSDGELLFNIPRSVLVCAECMFITDFKNGVICLDMFGNRKWIYRKLNFPWGLCFTSNEDLLIAAHKSENIVVVSKVGETIGELLNKSDGVVSPRALSFDEQNRRLLVTSKGRLLKWFEFENFDI